jgi:hypothetical protein
MALCAVGAGALAAVLVPPPQDPDAVVYHLGATDWRLLAVAVPDPDRDRPGQDRVVELAAGLPSTGPAGDQLADASRHRAAQYAAELLDEPVAPVALGHLRGPSGALALTLASMQLASGDDWSPVPMAATGDLDGGRVLPVGALDAKVDAARRTATAVVFIPTQSARDLVPTASGDDRFDRMRAAGSSFERTGRPFTVVAVTHVADVLWFVCGVRPGKVCDLATRASAMDPINQPGPTGP